MSELLIKAQYPHDLRSLNIDQLPQLAQELREFIINIVAAKGGHLGANLGAIELAIAIHYCYNTPIDNLVWDVGHQAYPHKILTGRKDVFETNRQLGGISGFPNRAESIYDTFGTGHSSTSISAALGMAIASSIKGKKEVENIAVIGDSSFASGMAFEALNHAGTTEGNFTVILNDNAMGIDPSVGAFKKYLSKEKGLNPGLSNLIEAFNFNYLGPIDGHNLEELISAIETLKKTEGLKFLYVKTTKGKGLKQAEKNQVKYHAPGKFDSKTGELIPHKIANQAPKFSKVLGETLLELYEDNDQLVSITPAMLTGSGLVNLIKKYPNRTFDVGIAEQHAVTLAAGIITQGLIPFCVIYSTFLQRAYDQTIHDVALQNLPVVFCIDRAGLVGQDGATHHGVFDIAFLRCIPNLIIACPSDEIEFRNMIYTASLRLTQPIAIRFPRGQGFHVDWKKDFRKVEIGKGRRLKQGNKIALLTVGKMTQIAIEAISRITDQSSVAHYDMRFVKPLDVELLKTIFDKFDSLITIEDGVIKGGFGSAILEEANDYGYKGSIKILGVPDQFIEHGSTEELYDICGLSVDKVHQKLNSILNKTKPKIQYT